MNADSGFTAADVMLLFNCAYLREGYCDLCFSDLNCDGRLTPADLGLELLFIFANLPPPC